MTYNKFMVVTMIIASVIFGLIGWFLHPYAFALSVLFFIYGILFITLTRVTEIDYKKYGESIYEIMFNNPDDYDQIINDYRNYIINIDNDPVTSKKYYKKLKDRELNLYYPKHWD